MNILENKTYLYMTEFFSGMAVMAIELGANRLLAPYFSSSQIVWTIIIGTIMIAMAIGNIWGGRSADKNPDPARLYRRIMLAAIWIALIPVVGKYVILGISGLLVLTINTHFLIIAAFLSCMVIFVFPLMLLGTVTPCLAKYTTRNLENNGQTIGTLGAFNTIGSIIGTFLPTFLTIPTVGTAITFLIFAGILFLLAMIYFIATKTHHTLCVVSASLFVFACFFGHQDGYAFWEKNLIYEGESVYNYLQVKETSNATILSTNVLFGVQSMKMKSGNLTGMFYDYDLAGPAALAQENIKILILGNGTGTFASQCQKYFPKASIKAIEIDEKITSLAKTYFDYDNKIPTITYDGRAYLQATKEKYDMIMIDAYQDITIPFQMSSKEFFTLVKSHLSNQGIMAVNMNMHSSSQNSINAYLSDTISSVFKSTYIADVDSSTNRELYACKNGHSFLGRLKQNKSCIQNQELSDLMTVVASELVEYKPTHHLLTDDQAPVELLGMNMLDEMISQELGHYQSILKEKGIQGLLES